MWSVPFYGKCWCPRRRRLRIVQVWLTLTLRVAKPSLSVITWSIRAVYSVRGIGDIVCTLCIYLMVRIAWLLICRMMVVYFKWATSSLWIWRVVGDALKLMLDSKVIDDGSVIAWSNTVWWSRTTLIWSSRFISRRELPTQKPFFWILGLGGWFNWNFCDGRRAFGVVGVMFNDLSFKTIVSFS
jgi:hypothetical protein